MAKKATAGELVSPANLWGKPLPRIPTGRAAAEKPEGKGTRMHPDDDEIDSDVDAELDDDEAEEVAEPELEVEEDDESGAELETSDEPEGEEDDEDNAVEDFEDEEDGDDSVADTAESSVEAAESAPRDRKSRTTVRVDAMAEKKTMSDHVRDEIAARKSAGESLRGVDIVAALAKRKIKVGAAQVSQLLKKAGMGGKSRAGRKAAPAPVAAGKDHEERSRRANKAKNARADAGGLDLPWSQLSAAKAFVMTCDGSVDTAMSVLTTLQKLQQFVS